MSTIEVDKAKVDRIVRDTLMMLQGSALHPLEIVLALSEAIGRVVVGVDHTDIVRMELLDQAVKHMARTVEAGRARVLHG